MTDVKKGGLPPGPPGQPVKGATPSKAGQALLRAHNAAGKQAHSTPKGEYQRPHRVHTGGEARIAAARHHQAALEAEAAEHFQRDLDPNQHAVTLEKKDENRRIEGLNFDEERKKKGRQRRDDDDRDDREDAEEAAALAQAAAAKGFAADNSTGRYFQDAPVDRMGDPKLVDPNDMKRILGPSARFAQHAMLLAEERLKAGLVREDAIAYLAELYLGVEDRAYANKALREFGCGTGIIDLYPLEVIEHLLEHVPSFFSRVSKGTFFTAPKSGAYKGETGRPIVLTYPPELRIRGFAVKDGAKPGYVFEPVDPPGTYHLTFLTPGRFQVLVSAISKQGAVVVEELDLEIAQGASALDDATAIKREKQHEADLAEEEARQTSAATPSAPAKKDDLPTKDALKISFPRRI